MLEDSQVEFAIAPQSEYDTLERLNGDVAASVGAASLRGGGWQTLGF
jgi:hypothetical protein